MARVKKVNPRPAEPVASPEAPVSQPQATQLRALARDWVEPATHQRFSVGVPTVAEPYTEWLQCQVAAGMLEVVDG